jgi:uncharacterized protein (TIGR02391 family)
MVDIPWARAKLTDYLDLCQQIKAALVPGEGWNSRAEALNQEAELRVATVQRILFHVEPSNSAPLKPPSYSSHDGELRVRRALGALLDQEETDAHFTTNAPEIPADSLHPIVWSAASVLWETGEYRVAVGQAALALATQIKARAGSKLNDRKLMQDVFSPDGPKNTGARLHFSGVPDEEAWRSRQQGLHFLAQGAYAGIRNISAHEEETWSEQLGLEYLTVLSVVARWADETVVVTG